MVPLNYSECVDYFQYKNSQIHNHTHTHTHTQHICKAIAEVYR